MTHLRVIIRFSSDDASELEAQALNNDSRLNDAGIAALKFASTYLAAGNVSQSFPSPEAGDAPAWGTNPGMDLHVFVRITDEDAYELKAQTLNANPLLNKVGISDVRMPGENQNPADDNQTVLSLKIPKAQLERPRLPATDLIVTLRMTDRDARQLTAADLNDDPRLRRSGIPGIKLKQEIPVPQAPKPATPAPAAPPKKKRRLVGCLSGFLFLCVGGTVLLSLIAVGIYFFVPNLTINLTDPVATTAIVAPLEPAASTATHTLTPATIPASLTPTLANTTQTQPSTATMTVTASQTPGLSCQPAQGVVNAEQLSCRYGPGASYLYRSGLFLGNNVEVLGKADTTYGVWLYLLSSQTGIKCWVNSKYVDVDQDLACLQSYYPEKAPLILFPTNLFPSPSNVQAERSGTNVSIYWTGYNLALADRESANSPRYLLELWTCQGGEIVFTPLGTSDEFADILDEPGCSEPSHGQIFLAHKSGYIGPSYIPWP